MQKQIIFDRQTKDFAAYVDGVLIGFFKTSTAAQAACDRYVADALS